MKHLSRFDIEAIADKYVQAYMALPDVRNTQIWSASCGSISCRSQDDLYIAIRFSFCRLPSKCIGGMVFCIRRRRAVLS